MSFSNVRIVNQGFFKESRCFLETFDQDNDVNLDNDKAGIRCHGWLTAFFLRIFGKIVSIKTDENKTIYLNKNSFQKWRERHKTDAQELEEGTLPTAKQIIEGRNVAISAKREREERDLEEKKREALALHNEISALGKEIEDLRQQQQKLGAEQVIKANENKLRKLKGKLLKANARIAFVKETKQKKQAEIARLEREIEDLKPIIEQNKKTLQELQEAQVGKQKLDLNGIEYQIEEKRKALEAKEKRLTAMLDGSRDLGDYIQKQVREGAAAKSSYLSALANSPVSKMLTDIEKVAHPKLKKLMTTLVDKFDPAKFKSWTFNEETKKFTLKLGTQAKVWVRPTEDNGNPSKQTPRGVILILGNKDGEVKGRLEKGKIHFNRDALTSYCEYRKWPVSGEADGHIETIAYHAQEDQVVFQNKGTARNFPNISEQADTKKYNFNTVIVGWGKAEVVDGNHEQFLKDKPKK